MGIKVKQNGQWVEQHVLSGDTNITDLNLQVSDWQKVEPIEQTDKTKFKISTEVAGLSSDYQAVALLEYTGEDIFDEIVCETNHIVIFASKIPTAKDGTPVDVIGTAIFSINNIGAQNRIYLVGGVTDSQLNEIISQISAELGLLKSNDGYVDFTNVRQLEKARFTKASYSGTEGRNGEQAVVDGEPTELKSEIVAEYFLEGSGESRKDYFYLDKHDYPVCGSSNGKNWTIEWEGFDEQQEEDA